MSGDEVSAFEDNLPLNGRVKINWKASSTVPAFTENGIYLGYIEGNIRRCAVRVHGNMIWVDRSILSPASAP